MPGSGRRWWGYLTRQRYRKSATNDAWELTHRSIAKENSQASPYLIANEWIASQIAAFLRLPVPPAALTRGGSGRKGMFASLEFGGPDSEPDDVEPAACVRDLPNLCVGILFFDVLIANADRHIGNIRVDSPQAPRQIAIIDHDRALFGCWENEGGKRLSELKDRLGITGGSVTGQNRHCFLDLIKADDHFEEWFERIRNIPRWFIKELCDEVLQLPISRDEADAATDFLDHRRTNINKIWWENRHEFSGIAQPGLFDKHEQ